MNSTVIASDRCFKAVASEIHVEDIVLNAISQAQEDKYYLYHLHEEPNIVKCIEAEKNHGCQGLIGGGHGYIRYMR